MRFIMTKKYLPLCLILILLAACTALPGETSTAGSPSLDATGLAQTAAQQVTADAAATRQAETPTATLRLSPTLTPSPVITLDRTRPVFGTPTSIQQCNQAAAGNPIDVTVPDGTVFAPGEIFSKTWRIINDGTCTWTRMYALVFFSGSSLNATQVNYLPAEVPPGGVIDLTVELEAPQDSGVYQSNWMLSDADGELFGLGPNGDAPFWARIEVVSMVTDTPKPTPTATATPVVYFEGQAALADQDQLDMDSGESNPKESANADMVFLFGGDPQYVMMTLNGTQWMIYGEEAPNFAQCQVVEMSGSAVSFEAVAEGTYLCYRTSDGLPGRLLMEGFDAESEQLQISFLTWAVP
jgi:hypothetical protein